jgi:hypothetical protein
MNKKRIQTYNDLLEERQELELLLKAQRELLHTDIQQLKLELRPASLVMNQLGNFFSRDKSNWLITAGTSSLVNLFIRKTPVAKAGWLTQFLVSFFLKNYTSHVAAVRKNKWMQRLFSWIGKKNHNGQAAPEQIKKQP